MGKELSKKYQEKLNLKGRSELLGKTIHLDMENNSMDLINVRGKIDILVKIVGISAMKIILKIEYILGIMDFLTY